MEGRRVSQDATAFNVGTAIATDNNGLIFKRYRYGAEERKLALLKYETHFRNLFHSPVVVEIFVKNIVYILTQ